MAFTLSTFTNTGGSSRSGIAPQLWTYKTTDASAAVGASGYFNIMATSLYPGDHIFCVQSASLTDPYASITSVFRFYVSTVSNGVVTVSTLT